MASVGTTELYCKSPDPIMGLGMRLMHDVHILLFMLLQNILISTQELNLVYREFKSLKFTCLPAIAIEPTSTSCNKAYPCTEISHSSVQGHVCVT